VDISRDILEMSDIAFPDPAEHPLRDPRVEVIVEDGRFFLQTTSRRYDLITSEPPPPKHAGVVNLYTREYFQLIHDRLEEGGVNSYWLPVHQLTFDDTRAIIRAYCEVFPNCSLWGGIGYSWMLAGFRAPVAAVTEEAFSRQWREPEVAAEMRMLALEQPEQLAALFMLDAEGLGRLTEGVPPLTDDHPKRLGNELPGPADFAAHRSLMNAEQTTRARRAKFAAQILPETIRARALPYFDYQDMLERGALPPPRGAKPDRGPPRQGPPDPERHPAADPRAVAPGHSRRGSLALHSGQTSRSGARRARLFHRGVALLGGLEAEAIQHGDPRQASLHRLHAWRLLRSGHRRERVW